jgi:hypothetical protein
MHAACICTTDTSPAAAAAWFGKDLPEDSPSASSNRDAGATSGAVSHQETAAGPAELPDATIMRACGMVPAALAALMGRVVVNARIAACVPGASAAELMHETSMDAAAVVARGGAGWLRSNTGGHGQAVGKDKGAGYGDQTCLTCGLPLSVFGHEWHAHDSPGQVAPGFTAPRPFKLAKKADGHASSEEPWLSAESGVLGWRALMALVAVLLALGMLGVGLGFRV